MGRCLRGSEDSVRGARKVTVHPLHLEAEAPVWPRCPGDVGGGRR